MPRYSIVVPSHRRPDLLREALASVAQQTRDDWECIVVFDGDRTSQSVVPTDDPRFSFLLLEENSGPATARNAGVQKSSGEWLLFLDDDDLLAPKRIELIDSCPSSADIVLCWSQFLGDRESTTRYRFSGHVDGRLLASTTPHLGATAVRRSAWEPMDETYLSTEDVEWWIRMRGRSIETIDEVGYLVRRHAGVRALHGTERRIIDSRRVLGDHADFFGENPEARAFRLRRIGVMATRCGDRSGAVRALGASLRAKPRLPTLKNLFEAVIGGRRGAGG